MRTWCVNAFAQWSNAPLPSQSERINLFQQWCTTLAWVIVLTNLLLTLLLSLFFFYIITLKQSVNVIISVCYCSCWEIGHFKSISFLFNAQLELCLYAVTSVLHHKSKKKYSKSHLKPLNQIFFHFALRFIQHSHLIWLAMILKNSWMKMVKSRVNFVSMKNKSLITQNLI